MLYVFATEEAVQVGNWDWRWFSLRLVFLVGGDLFRKQDESVPLLTINQKYLKIQFSKNYNLDIKTRIDRNEYNEELTCMEGLCLRVLY